MSKKDEAEALDLALDALEEIALAGMSGTGQESEEAMTAWHARQAWKFIGIAARALEPIKQALAAPPVQEPRWYCVDKTGVAILCTDEDDAKQGAKQAEKAWPRFAPYRAVQLCEYTAPPAPVPLTDEQREEIAKGWRGRIWTGGDIIDATEAAHKITAAPEKVKT
jgi:nitroreductase